MKGRLGCLYCAFNNNSNSSRSVVILVLLIWSKLILCSGETIRTANETTNLSKLSSIHPKESFDTPLFSTGNNLWDNLIRDCLQKPSFSCIQKNIYVYLSDTLQASTLNLTNRLQFSRNTINFDNIRKSIENNEIDDDNGE